MTLNYAGLDPTIYAGCDIQLPLAASHLKGSHEQVLIRDLGTIQPRFRYLELKPLQYFGLGTT